MRSFVALFVIALASAAQAGLTEEQKQKLVEYYKQCTESTSVDENLVQKARKGEFADDPKLKEFFGCMFTKVGFLNDAGEIQLDVIKQKMPSDVNKDEAEKVLNACKDQKGESKADTAFLLYKCYWESTPNHITLA